MPIPKRRQVESSHELAQLLLKQVPVIPGRSFIPGRKTPTFTPVLNLELRQMTFRRCAIELDVERGLLEDAYARHASALVNGRHDMLVMVPRHVRDLGERELFWWGWTLIELDGEVLTFQRVIFPQAKAVEKGGCDQGAIYQLPRRLLSAWSGRTDEQAARHAA